MNSSILLLSLPLITYCLCWGIYFILKKFRLNNYLSYYRHDSIKIFSSLIWFIILLVDIISMPFKYKVKKFSNYIKDNFRVHESYFDSIENCVVVLVDYRNSYIKNYRRPRFSTFRVENIRYTNNHANLESYHIIDIKVNKLNGEQFKTDLSDMFKEFKIKRKLKMCSMEDL